MMPRWAVKAILLTVLVSIPLRCASATNHSVGGPTGWDLSSNVQAWSATNTFHVGDTLGNRILSHSPTCLLLCCIMARQSVTAFLSYLFGCYENDEFLFDNWL